MIEKTLNIRKHIWDHLYRACFVWVLLREHEGNILKRLIRFPGYFNQMRSKIQP